MDGTHEIDIFGKVFSFTLCLCVCVRESGGEGGEGERCQKEMDYKIKIMNTFHVYH